MTADEAFLDTNVILYLLSEDPTKADRAEELVAAGGIVSVQVLNEFASVANRKLGLSYVEVREILSTVRAACTVVPVDVGTHDLGLEIAERYRFSVYDGLIVAAALQAGCAVLYSEDLQHEQAVERLTIRNPFMH